MSKHLIYKKLEDGTYGEKLGSYTGAKDDSSANRSHLQAEPQASHFELADGVDEDCSELVLVAEVQAVEGVAPQPERWIKDGEADLLEDPLDETYTHVPAVTEVTAVEYSPEHYEIQESASLVLAKRQNKANAYLNDVRALREPLLKDADHSINAKLDDAADHSALSQWRKDLKACTDVLKKVDGQCKLTYEDSVASEFSFPAKP